MSISHHIVSGILTKEGTTTFLQGNQGKRHFDGKNIWEGYLTHWEGESVCGRALEQKDYETNLPIIILWPECEKPKTPFVELYYNERLVKYWASGLGHCAINVNGNIFNFSHLLNENEVISKEEYFFRPALGEFAPSPRNGRFEVLEDGKIFYDKFGRNFMRTIHVCRVEGLDTDKLLNIFKRELSIIKSTKPNKRKPEKYADFNFFTRSCSTIIRDGFNETGYTEIKAVFPRDLFVNAAYYFSRAKKLSVRIFKMPQLTVKEAPKSALSPLLNFMNFTRAKQLYYEN